MFSYETHGWASSCVTVARVQWRQSHSWAVINGQLLSLANSVVCFTGLGYLGMDGAQVLVYQPFHCQVLYEFDQLNFYCFSAAPRRHRLRDRHWYMQPVWPTMQGAPWTAGTSTCLNKVLLGLRSCCVYWVMFEEFRLSQNLVWNSNTWLLFLRRICRHQNSCSSK